LPPPARQPPELCWLPSARRATARTSGQAASTPQLRSSLPASKPIAGDLPEATVPGFYEGRISARLHQPGLPRRGPDLQRQPLRAGGEQELTPARRLELPPLLVAQQKGLLQLDGLTRTLSAEQVDRGVAGHHAARVAAQQVAGVLCREHEPAVVLPDPPGEADHEAADDRILEEEAQLVDDEQTPALPGLDPAPEGAGQQEVDGANHLLPQLPHAEHDDGGVEIDVGRSAEDRAQASPHPAREDQPGPALGEPGDQVPQDGLRQLGEVEGADSVLHPGAIRLVETADDDPDQVDGVGDRGTEPRLAGAWRPELEDVQGVAGAQGQLYG
jgi:hypothetical protein